jgi:hypothetical protein
LCQRWCPVDASACGPVPFTSLHREGGLRHSTHVIIIDSCRGSSASVTTAPCVHGSQRSTLPSLESTAVTGSQHRRELNCRLKRAYDVLGLNGLGNRRWQIYGNDTALPLWHLGARIGAAPLAPLSTLLVIGRHDVISTVRWLQVVLKFTSLWFSQI